MKTRHLPALLVALALTACPVTPIDSPDIAQDTAQAAADAADTASGPDAPDAPDASVDPDATSPTASWHVVASGLPAALLSATGAGLDDLWFTGADKLDGSGPWVVHGTDAGLRRLDLRPVDPEGGHVWWAALPDPIWVYLVGEQGRVFRYNRSIDVLEAVPSGTDATLYGVWGASAAEVWAVGGYVHPRTGPPTIVRIIDGVGAVVADLPEGLHEDTTLFKVWGTAADDVWVVGERGTVLRWDGAAWSLELLDGGPRLVTLHGSGPDDMVVVGGASQAVIWERKGGGAWVEASPGPYPLLNGVFVAPDGAAVAVGLLGQTFFRDTAGAWTPGEGPPLLKDWHAGWIDPRGDAWLVGGNLLSASAFNDGALLRWGPARTDLPTGPIIDLDDEPNPEPDADVTEQPDAAPTDASDDDTALADVGPDDTALADADPADATSPFEPALEIGEVTLEGEFTPLTPLQTVEIVQGIQGGIHVEVGLRFTWPGVEHPLMAYVLMTVEIDGVEEARFLTLGYPVPRISPNVYRTYTIPVIFTQTVAAPFVGKTATLRALIKLPGDEERTAAIDLVLADEL